MNRPSDCRGKTALAGQDDPATMSAMNERNGHASDGSEISEPGRVTLERPTIPATLPAIAAMLETMVVKVTLLEQEFGRISDVTEENRKLQASLQLMIDSAITIHVGLGRAVATLERLAASFPKP